MNGKIMRLKMELVDRNGNSIRGRRDMSLAEADDGIIREVMIPADTSLFELHGAIQSLFGFKDRHLHQFSLRKNDFNRLTGDNLRDYAGLCGTLFKAYNDERFECCLHDMALELKEDGDFSEFVREELNSAGESIENSSRFSIEDSFYLNRLKAFRRYEREDSGTSTITVGNTRDRYEWLESLSRPKSGNIGEKKEFFGRYNALLERIKIGELLCVDKESISNYHDGFESWKEKEEAEIEKCVDGLIAFRERDSSTFDEMASSVFRYEQYKEEYEVMLRDNEIAKNYTNDVTCLKDEYRKRMLKESLKASGIIQDYVPRLFPAFGGIEYKYDCGDEWRIEINCTDIYTVETEEYDADGMYSINESPQEYMADVCSIKAAANRCAYGVSESRNGFNISNGHWSDAFGRRIGRKLRETLNAIYMNHRSLCVFADGLNLIDDIGGVEGYFAFLRGISEKEQADASMQAAAELRWNRRNVSGRNMIC